MGQQYSAPHFKTHSRNIEHRCSLLTNKRSNECRQLRKKVAKLLSEGKDESARLECLQMLRYERYMVCYKLFTLAGRCLADSVGIITKAQVCPMELLDSCCCIIFAADRFIDIPELKHVTEQLFAKFGEHWVQRVRKNEDSNVNPNLLRALTDPNPVKDDMITFLTKLGKEYDVQWTPKEGFEAETLGCMKAFPLGYMDDGTTDIYIKLDDDDDEVEPQEQEEEQPQDDDGGDFEPPAYIEEPKIEEPKVEQKQPEVRKQYYYIDPNPPARYDPPMPIEEPKPIPQQPQPPVVGYPAEQPKQIASYPALPPQEQPKQIAAYPALAPEQKPVNNGPVSGYPALPVSNNSNQQQQQQQQQPQQGEKDAATLALERRLAMLNGGK